MERKPCRYKCWDDTIADVSSYILDERTVAKTDLMSVEIGFQFQHALSYYHRQIACVEHYENPKYNQDYYLANYFNAEDGRHYIINWRYDASKLSSHVVSKRKIHDTLVFMVWIPTQKGIIGNW